MAERCERCGNDDEGDRIYYCRDCSTYFCDACLGEDVTEGQRSYAAVVYGTFCPECTDGGWLGRVARIGPEGSDE